MKAVRCLLLGVACSVVAAPMATGGQRGAMLPRLGLLAISRSPRVDAFLDELRALGYVEGQTVTIEQRYGAFRLERLPEMARELVRLQVDVIVAPNPPSARAAFDATKSIPIVMRGSDDPVMEGFAASIPRPGGIVTGVYSLAGELVGKRMELLKETVPAVSRVAVLWNPEWPSSLPEYKEAERAARALGVQLRSVEAKRPGDFESALRAAGRANGGALITLRNPFAVSPRAQIGALAARAKIPAIYDEREFVEAGGQGPRFDGPAVRPHPGRGGQRVRERRWGALALGGWMFRTIHGRVIPMKTTIDSAGRLVIPKAIRQEAGLRPGMVLEVQVRAGRIEIEPAPLPIKLVRKGRLLVAVPQMAVGTLTTGMVEETRRTLRRERPPRS